MDGNTKKEIDTIEQQIGRLNEKLLEKRPSHFKARDIVNAFFASLIIGLTFIFKGAMVSTSLRLSNYHLAAIILITLIILSLEIYFVGYTRVSQKEKRSRHFGQFWLKRILTYYSISIIVSVFIVYLFGINEWIGGTYGIVRLVVAVSMPCAIGAAIPSMLRQY